MGNRKDRKDVLAVRTRNSYIMLCFTLIYFASYFQTVNCQNSDKHINNVIIRSDRVFMLNGNPFFPVMVNCELGPDNYRCELRKPDGSSWGFNIINLMTEVTWHFKRFGGYCPGEMDLDFCGSGYRIRNIISGDTSTSPQYKALLGPMGWDIDWYTNANRIFNYLDTDMYVLADDYAFYPSTVDWFEQNGGCSNPNCLSDCDHISPRFDQTTRNNSIDRIDSLAKLPNSRLIGFYGLDDPNMMHTIYTQQNEQYYYANFPQQALDFQNTYKYAKSRYPNSTVIFGLDALYYPKTMSPGDPNLQDWNVVLNDWVTDAKSIVAAADVVLSGFFNASPWASTPNWWLYPHENLAMWYPNHLEHTLFPRVLSAFNRPIPVIGGFAFDDPNFAPNPPSIDQKAKWITYIGLEKGQTGLYYFGWHKGNDQGIYKENWNAIRNLVDTLINVKELAKNVFTKPNVGPVGHNISGSTNQNVSYAAYLADHWNDYYLLVTNNPNGELNETPEPSNLVTLSSAVSDWKSCSITEVFSSNPIQVTSDGRFQYELPCWGVALFHVKSRVLPIDGNDPVTFYLNQNYPNPFNPATEISFGLSKGAFVELNVYNDIGQKVRVLASGYKNAGNYIVEFDGTDLSSGLYIYSLSAGAFRETKKMLLIK